MLRWDRLAGMSLTLLLLAGGVAAEDGYDNPGLGDTPCLILKSYHASSTGDAAFGAVAEVENVCGRSVEVAFCFPLVTPDEGAAPHCQNGVVRPWGSAEITVSDLPARLAGPDFSWRWHGHPMDSDR